MMRRNRDFIIRNTHEIKVWKLRIKRIELFIARKLKDLVTFQKTGDEQMEVVEQLLSICTNNETRGNRPLWKGKVRSRTRRTFLRGEALHRYPCGCEVLRNSGKKQPWPHLRFEQELCCLSWSFSASSIHLHVGCWVPTVPDSPLSVRWLSWPVGKSVAHYKANSCLSFQKMRKIPSTWLRAILCACTLWTRLGKVATSWTFLTSSQEWPVDFGTHLWRWHLWEVPSRAKWFSMSSR